MRERELYGRLVGEKLSSRQFEMLYGIGREDSEESLRLIKNKQRQAFINDRDVIRLTEESFESYRRRQVM